MRKAFKPVSCTKLGCRSVSKAHVVSLMGECKLTHLIKSLAGIALAELFASAIASTSPIEPANLCGVSQGRRERWQINRGR
jgi:hypothetical protein